MGETPFRCRTPAHPGSDPPATNTPRAFRPVARDAARPRDLDKVPPRKTSNPDFEHALRLQMQVITGE